MKNKKSPQEPSPDRIFFNDDATRDRFFASLKLKFGSWHSLRNHFSIRRTQLERIRNGTRSIPSALFSTFLGNLPKEQQKSYLDRVHSKDKNWGRSKGGVSTYSKYPEIFKKGRRKGSFEIKFHFDINTPLKEDLAELIGAYIGDGFTNAYRSSYKVQFAGHAILDKEYHEKFLLRVIKSISSDCNPIITTKDNTTRLTLNSKELHTLLTKRFGFPAGKKTFTVKIPNEILNSKNKTILYSCLRGIFDTDGYSFFDKRKTYTLPYVRIGLHMESKPLMQQVFQILTDAKINTTMARHGTLLQINGIKECRKFMSLVGFRNQRHLAKLRSVFPSLITTQESA